MKNFLTIVFTTILLTGCVSVTKEYKRTYELCAMEGYRLYPPIVSTVSYGSHVTCTGKGRSVRCNEYDDTHTSDSNQYVRNIYIRRCTADICLEKYKNEKCITGTTEKDEIVNMGVL